MKNKPGANDQELSHILLHTKAIGQQKPEKTKDQIALAAIKKRKRKFKGKGRALILTAIPKKPV